MGIRDLDAHLLGRGRFDERVENLLVGLLRIHVCARQAHDCLAEPCCVIRRPLRAGVPALQQLGRGIALDHVRRPPFAWERGRAGEDEPHPRPLRSDQLLHRPGSILWGDIAALTRSPGWLLVYVPLFSQVAVLVQPSSSAIAFASSHAIA